MAHRVVKSASGTTTVYIFSGSKVIAEYDNGAAAGSPTREYLYSGGALLARIGSVSVRFTNDSCSACEGAPVGGGDRNLFVNSITVGSTIIPPNDPSVSYTSAPCNRYENGVGILACNGEMITTTSTAASAQSLTVNAYGSPDYNVYPHLQLLVDGAVVGEWDVTGTAQNYTATLVRYYSVDHLGSTRVCTDASGNSVGTCNYEPFGEVQPSSTCSVPVNYRFAAMEFDSETGLYHTWFRYYDANQGRWMGVDPLGGSIDDPQSLDRYAYVVNDPGSLVDLPGLETRHFSIAINNSIG